MTPLVEVTGLAKTYRTGGLLHHRSETVAVSDVSFALGRAETLAIVGESGAGKSTVGRLVLRLVAADRGRVVFDGVDIMRVPAPELRRLRRSMQMIFQDPYGSFDPRVPIGRSVGEPLLVHDRAARAVREEKAVSMLSRVGLGAHHAGLLPRSLSGGQLQRAAIARALTLEPSFIVCDEPVTALDVSVRAQVLNLMKDLQDDMGIAYLLISHDMPSVGFMADRVAVMRAGRVVEEGTVDDVFDHPRDPYTASLLAAVPIPDPTRRTLLGGGDGRPLEPASPSNEVHR